jgi:hypothetical protein
MEFQTKIRMQLVMVGLGAALLMAGSARAQQDVDPTYFDVNPGTPAVSKVVPVQTGQSPTPAAESSFAQSELALASSKEETLEAGVARMAIVDTGIVMLLFGGVISIVLYAKAATRRRAYRRVRPLYPISAATAQ